MNERTNELIVVVFVVIAKFQQKVEHLERAVYIHPTDTCTACVVEFSTLTIQWTMQWISILIGIKNNSVQGKCCLRAVLYCDAERSIVLVCVYSSIRSFLTEKKTVLLCSEHRTFPCVKHEQIYVLLHSAWNSDQNWAKQNEPKKCVGISLFWLDSKSVCMCLRVTNTLFLTKLKRKAAKSKFSSILFWILVVGMR